MIVRGVIKDGAIVLQTPIPARWEGRKVRIRSVRPRPTAEELAAWEAELDQNAALIDPSADDEVRRIFQELHDEENAGMRAILAARGA